ncbi:MAG: LacI family DNA-binding transcriptional regulator [Gorillibacterium sp.]|nr:LacI family DNA-binding transcriptional regulator [Gorillibacterium sp.]
MATVKDIARLAGVSPSTVSRVLSGDASFSVSDDTRDSIIACAKQLKYKAVQRKNASRTEQVKDYKIALVTHGFNPADQEDTYYASIRAQIEREIQRLGLHITATIRSVGRESYDSLLSMDGIIVIGKFQIAPDDLILNRLHNIVFVDYCPDSSRYDSVIVDFEQVTVMAVDHLLSLGYRKIGFIGSQDSVTRFGTDVGVKRVDSRQGRFESYMKEKGLYEPRYVHIGNNYTMLTGYQLMKQAITAKELPEAFVLASDPMAIATYKALEEAGLKVPQDVAIVSIDDIEMASYANPPLTTIKVYTEQMGQSAVNLLMERITGREIPLKVVVPCRLIIRGSCGAVTKM